MALSSSFHNLTGKILFAQGGSLKSSGGEVHPHDKAIRAHRYPDDKELNEGHNWPPRPCSLITIRLPTVVAAFMTSYLILLDALARNAASYWRMWLRPPVSFPFSIYTNLIQR